MTRRSVCVDLDGLLADYSRGWRGLDEIGEPLPGAVEFTHHLRTFARVVIYTTRCNADFKRPAGETVETLCGRVTDWLDRHGFAWDEVYTGQGKPMSAAIVDDRAVQCRPQDGDPEGEFARALADCRRLCGL